MGIEVMLFMGANRNFSIHDDVLGLKRHPQSATFRELAIISCNAMMDGRESFSRFPRWFDKFTVLREAKEARM